jgi:putative acetyltransferase
MDIMIRKEENTDHQWVREVVRAAFPTEEESKLVDVLRENNKAIISLVAVINDKVLGHILFSPVSTPPSEAKGIGLAPVSVKPEFQGQGIGSQLIREGLRLCKELQHDYVVVLGDPNYYQRFGFQKASDFGIQNEYGVDDEFMMIQFSTGSELQGLVRYALEFSMFSV